MRITEFELRNFKSFGDYNNPSTGVLPSLRKMNMVYGENNSGKSNLLKFIDLIFSGKSDTESGLNVEGESSPLVRAVSTPFWKGKIHNSPFIFHKNERSREIKFYFIIEFSNQELFSPSFAQSASVQAEYPSVTAGVSILRFDGVIKSYSDPYLSELVLKKVELNGRELYLDDGTAKYYFRSGVPVQALLGDSLLFESFMSILNSVVSFIDTDRFLSEEKENRKSIRLTAKNYKNWLHNLSLDVIHHDLYLKYIDFVKRHHSIFGLFRNFAPSFATNDHGQVELIVYNGNQRLPIDSYGTGIQQLLYLLALLFSTKARIVLIEELELNLSPKSQKKLFQLVRNLINEGVIDQVIFTTHSPYFKFTTDFSFYEVNMNVDKISTVENVAAVRPSFFNNGRLT